MNPIQPLLPFEDIDTPEADEPFSKSIPTQTVLVEVTESDIEHKIGELFYTLIGEHNRLTIPTPTQFEITLSTDYLLARTFRRSANDPIAVVITSSGIAG